MTPSPKFSILILTIPSRKEKFERLMKILHPQIPADGSVEVIIKHVAAIADGGPCIGHTRNEALEDAAGEYICFVDDDDRVNPRYVELLLNAIKTNPDAVELHGHYLSGNNKPELFVHSIQYTEWKTVDGVHQRPPNHLNVVKRELALQARFTEKNFGEDHDYSMALRSLLKTESPLEEIIYFYEKL